MPDTTQCGFDASTAARYLAGRLGEAEAEAFEAHYFGCERCWAEVRTAQELRAALATHGAARPASRRPWLPFAAAAALLVSVGAWVLVRPSWDQRAFRAPRVDALGPRASVTPEGRVSASWSSIPGARVYRVRLVSAEGRLVAEGEAASPPLILDAGLATATAPLYLTVQALGPDRQVLESSPPLRLPN